VDSAREVERDLAVHLVGSFCGLFPADELGYMAASTDYSETFQEEQEEKLRCP